MKDLYVLINELRDIHNKLLLNHKYPGNGVGKEWVLLFAMGKADKTLVAISLLCNHGLGEDAAILSRSLFELALNVEYIFKRGDFDLSGRFFSYDWVVRDDMYTYLKNKKLISDCKEIQEIAKEAKKAKETYSFKNAAFGWSDKNIFDMLVFCEWPEYYFRIYTILCSLSHPNPRNLNDYIKIQDENLLLDAGPSDNFVRESLVLSVDMFFKIVKRFNDVFKKGFDDSLKVIETEILEYNK